MLASSLGEMEELASAHFRDLIGVPVVRDYTLDLAALDLPSVDAKTLERVFSEENIWNVIRSLPLDKSPGPDLLPNSTRWCGLRSKPL